LLGLLGDDLACWVFLELSSPGPAHFHVFQGWQSSLWMCSQLELIDFYDQGSVSVAKTWNLAMKDPRHAMRPHSALPSLFLIILFTAGCNALQLSRPPAGVYLDPPVSRSSLLGAAEYLATSGLLNAGYEYIMIGDGWAKAERGPKGELVAKNGVDLEKLGAELRRMGIKVGITANGGALGCKGGAGSLGRLNWADSARLRWLTT